MPFDEGGLGYVDGPSRKDVGDTFWVAVEKDVFLL